MHANWNEKCLIQVGYFSRVNAGQKPPHSAEISHLSEKSHFI